MKRGVGRSTRRDKGSFDTPIPTEKCAESGKRKYHNRYAALYANARLEARAYFCPFCRYWHITRRRKEAA